MNHSTLGLPSIASSRSLLKFMPIESVTFLNCMQKCLEIVNRVLGEDKISLGNLDYQEYIMASKYDH